MYCPRCNQDCQTSASGLNQTGLILFIVLILFCLPLCWLPFIIDSCKKHTCNNCGQPLD